MKLNDSLPSPVKSDRTLKTALRTSLQANKSWPSALSIVLLANGLRVLFGTTAPLVRQNFKLHQPHQLPPVCKGCFRKVETGSSLDASWAGFHGEQPQHSKPCFPQLRKTTTYTSLQRPLCRIVAGREDKLRAK